MWRPEAAADTSAAGNRHKHKASPYTGRSLKGRVDATIVGGRVVSLHAALSSQSCGGVVKRERAQGGKAQEA